MNQSLAAVPRWPPAADCRIRGPGRQPRAWDSYPPAFEYSPRTKFSKSIEGEIADTPPGMGPAQKFYKQNVVGWRGPPVANWPLLHLRRYREC
jgi:hypothetical protein